MSIAATNNSPYLDGGFNQPVFQAQEVFRAVMDAMARPGKIISFEANVIPPKALTPIVAAIACSLCDADTTIFLDDPLNETTGVEQWLLFHTGAPTTRSASMAQFALISSPKTMLPLENFARGNQEYPEMSTTLILNLESLKDGNPLTLEGPGIKETTSFAPIGLPDHFLDGWQRNRALFPRGVDVICTDMDGIVCLPRSTTITQAGE